MNHVEYASKFYEKLFIEHGPTAKGVGWNSNLAQNLRYMKLLQGLDKKNEIDVLDFGCGWGIGFEILRSEDYRVKSYLGVDVNSTVIDYASSRYSGESTANFELLTDKNSSTILRREHFDLVLASGVFNIRFNEAIDMWYEYVKEQTKFLFSLTKSTLAINFLSSISDKEKQRDDHFYCDPSEYLKFLLQEVSDKVSLIHDYGMWDFCVIVKRDSND